MSQLNRDLEELLKRIERMKESENRVDIELNPVSKEQEIKKVDKEMERDRERFEEKQRNGVGRTLQRSGKTHGLTILPASPIKDEN